MACTQHDVSVRKNSAPGRSYVTPQNKNTNVQTASRISRPSKMSTSLPSLSTLQTAFHAFVSSHSPFRIFHTVSSLSTLPALPPKTLYILDSSFNPPTLAHLNIVTSALLSDRRPVDQKRLLLLLATQNADKASTPTSLEQRLGMMAVLAREVVSQVEAVLQAFKDHDTKGEPGRHALSKDVAVTVDIGVTTKPYFSDKATAIAESGVYGPSIGEAAKGFEQVYLIGFDTLIRLLNPVYYPPEHTLQQLGAFFRDSKVRATRRVGENWGEAEEQTAYLKALRDGKREAEGGRREWADRIELGGGISGKMGGVSSTKAREAVGRGDWKALNDLVPKGVRQRITEERLYVCEE